jgi:uncharacterized protein YndB with AHSA1/START domain
MIQGTLHTHESRSMIRFERRLAHPPSKVWRAITEPAELSSWFPAAARIEPKLAGKVIFDFQDGVSPVTEGVVTEFEQFRVLAYTWGDDLLRFELRADGAGCLLIFTHTFADQAGAASFASGWQTCLDALEHALDGKPFESPGRMVKLHEAYIAAFHLDEGAAEATPDGWRLRFERQLTQPIEAVWEHLTGAESAPALGEHVPSGFTAGPVQPGKITAVDPPKLLEYQWLHRDWPAGHIRWELGNGTGHGARLILTQTGPSELASLQSAALEAWKSRIETLAAELATNY